MLIGLTGGIASGKTTVANRWAELGATLIDADELAREVVAPGSRGLAAIVKTFGNAVIRDGELDRAALGEIVFKDPGKRRRLEAITHPLIRELAQLRVESAGEQTVVYVIPLLVETNSQLPFDRIVTVSAPEELRVTRMVTHRGLSPDLARARLASQASDAQREQLADIVINSDCSMAQLVARAEQVWSQLTEA